MKSVSIISFFSEISDRVVILRNLDKDEISNFENVLRKKKDELCKFTNVGDIVDIMFQNGHINGVDMMHILEQPSQKDRMLCLISNTLKTSEMLFSFIETLRLFDSLTFKLIENDIKKKPGKYQSSYPFNKHHFYILFALT